MFLVREKIIGATALLLASSLLMGGISEQAAAKNLSPKELRAVQERFKGHDHLSVDFVQSRYSKRRNRVFKTNGKAQFSKPDLFHWAIQSADPDHWIFDGKKLCNFKPAVSAATCYDTKGQQAKELQQIISLVFNFDELTKHYDVVEAREQGELLTIILQPKSKSDIATVDVMYSLKHQYVVSVKLNYAGDWTSYQFQTPSYGTVAAVAYKLPKGVKISTVQ